MVRFPSEEWIKRFKEELNRNAAYAEAAKDWEGDFLFVVEPDAGLPHEIVFYIDLWHGKCREALLLTARRHAQFVFKGPYLHWRKVIARQLDPLRGLIRGMFTVEGDSRVILEQAKAAQELVNTACLIDVE